MSNNKKVIYLILVIATIVVAVGISTYAYFNSSDGVNMEAPLNVATANSVFTASSEGDIVLNITYDKMTQANISANTIDNDNAIVTVTLDNENERDVISCTYDIVWVWDSADKYTESDVDLPYTPADTTYPYELSTKVDEDEEKDLSSFTWTEAGGITEAVIASKEIIVNGKGSITNTHNVEVKVYNIPVDQKNLFNKNFGAHIEVKNNKCTSEATLANYITNNVYTEDGAGGLYYHDGEGTYTNANLEAGDNSYRYSGTDPNNYLCFNEGCTDDEKYRIIGVIDNKVKVIKMTSVGYKYWDYSANNNWENSTIETYLNGEYLTNLGTNANLIDNTIWHVGGFSSLSKNAKGIYTAELSSTPTIDRKIGLMYVSDYGYAAAPTYWRTNLNSYSSSRGKDWLFTTNSFEWTISRYSGRSDRAIIVDSAGEAREDERGRVTEEYDSRPVFSLSSLAKLVSGKGTSTEPYIVTAGNITLANYIKNNVYKEDGVNGLYYHDGMGTYINANLEAGDNSYRYSGTDPNNYLCFKEGCTDDEKYRIIGVFDNKVKVIKMTSVGNKAWNSSDVNTWEGSVMETYLNGEYLTNLGIKANLINTTTWHVGGFNSAQWTSENAKGIYTLELNSTPTIDRKIGLMYANDYMYAAEPTYWNLVGYNSSDATKDYRASKGKDWMLTTNTREWAISHLLDYSNQAWGVRFDGIVNNGYVSATDAVRPAFVIAPSVKLSNGSGTSADPYIVG